jgi:hypothetical protein
MWKKVLNQKKKNCENQLNYHETAALELYVPAGHSVGAEEREEQKDPFGQIEQTD